MNNMTATEAGRNFSAAIKRTDTDGMIGIVKNGTRRYVLMKADKFEDMRKERIYGRRGDEICKVEIDGDRAAVMQILLEGNDLVLFQIADMPTAILKVSRNGNKVDVSANLDDAKALPEGVRKTSVMIGEDILWADPENHFNMESEDSRREYADFMRVKKALDELDELDASAVTEMSLNIIRRGIDCMKPFEN